MEYMSKPLFNAIVKAKQETCDLNGRILITPALAKHFLEKNVSNYRTKQETIVTKYSKDMENDLWETNGSPIVFSKEGILLDGQHRLNAIVKSGKSVVMYVIFDADPSSIFDAQHKRSIVQILRAMGYSVAPTTPAVARAVMMGKITTSTIGDRKICDYVIKNFRQLKKAENIVKTRFGKEKMVANKASCQTIAYCMLRTGEVSEDELIDFFKAMNSKKKCGIKRDVSPALALRKQIDSYDGHGDNLSNRFMEYTYLALKDFHAGIAVTKNFVYPDGGKNAERLIREVQCMDNMCPMAA